MAESLVNVAEDLLDANGHEEQKIIATIKMIAGFAKEKLPKVQRTKLRVEKRQQHEASKAAVDAKRAKMNHNHSEEDKEELVRLEAIEVFGFSKTRNGRKHHARRSKEVCGLTMGKLSDRVTDLMENMTLNGRVVTHNYDRSLRTAVLQARGIR